MLPFSSPEIYTSKEIHNRQLSLHAASRETDQSRRRLPPRPPAAYRSIHRGGDWRLPPSLHVAHIYVECIPIFRKSCSIGTCGPPAGDARSPCGRDRSIHKRRWKKLTFTLCALRKFAQLRFLLFLSFSFLRVFAERKKLLAVLFHLAEFFILMYSCELLLTP